MPRIHKLLAAALAFAAALAIFLLPYLAPFHPFATWLLLGAVLVAAFLAVIWAPARRALGFLAALGVAASISGCDTLAGLAKFNQALVPEFKPIDARIHSDITCGDLAAQLLGVAADQKLSAGQAVAIVQFCERRDATQVLTLDPQGARKVLQGALSKPPVALVSP